MIGAPIVPYITPLTQKINDYSGVPDFGFGVCDIFGSFIHGWKWPMQPLFPRKILYYAYTDNLSINGDVRFKTDDGQYLFPWQTSAGGTLPDSLRGTTKFPLSWCGRRRTNPSTSTNQSLLNSNNVVVSMAKSNRTLAFTTYSNGLHFITTSQNLTMEIEAPKVAAQGAETEGQYGIMVLIKVVEMPLGVKLSTKLYR